jgi:predicted phosphodiesterase
MIVNVSGHSPESYAECAARINELDKIPAIELKHDIFIYGHTHLWKLEATEQGDVVCNLGSITFPKGGNEPTFATYDDGVLRVRRMDGTVLQELVKKTNF